MRTETKIALTVFFLAALYLLMDTVANTELFVLDGLFDNLTYIFLVAASVVIIWVAGMIVLSALNKMKDSTRRGGFGRRRRFL